jgi:cofilin
MLYASSKDALRRKLVGLAIEMQGTDASEVIYDILIFNYGNILFI